jgi:hypothetical protein
MDTSMTKMEREPPPIGMPLPSDIVLPEPPRAAIHRVPFLVAALVTYIQR